MFAADMVRTPSACLLLLLAIACTESPREVVLSGPTMGTTYTVKVVPPDPGIEAATLRRAIEGELARIDEEMSTYRKESEISRFNASQSTEWIAVSRELATLVARSLEIAEASGGAVDVTVAPLVDLWGFGPAGERAGIPTGRELETARSKVGYRSLHARLEPCALRKEIPTLRVDLNAVAPGYAVDVVADRLSGLGIQRFMIDIGGEVKSRGLNSKNEPWRIAVERPTDTASVPFAVLALHDASVSTSGEYRHYYLYEGQRYSHTIDPRTGRPIVSAAAAVVVVAPAAVDADAWATALNVLGPESGYALAAQRQMPVMFILPDGPRLTARMTPEFEKYIAVRPQPMPVRPASNDE